MVVNADILKKGIKLQSVSEYFILVGYDSDKVTQEGHKIGVCCYYIKPHEFDKKTLKSIKDGLIDSTWLENHTYCGYWELSYILEQLVSN